MTGYIRPPDAASIAEALDRFYADRATARRMGAAAYERMLSLKITWDNVIAALTS